MPLVSPDLAGGSGDSGDRGDFPAAQPRMPLYFSSLNEALGSDIDHIQLHREARTLAPQLDISHLVSRAGVAFESVLWSTTPHGPSRPNSVCFTIF